jgi:glycosyltransferase involved in cell wall biosynthesis
MKRVLLLIKGLGRGGAEQLLVNAAPHLERNRFDYEVAYVLPWKDSLRPQLQEANLPVHCLEGGSGAGWLRTLRRLTRERGVDLIHAHLPYAAIGARVAVGGRLPIVYTEHNVWPRYHRATYWGNALTFPRNRHVFAVSDEVRRSIRYPRSLRGLRMPPVETLHHGLDLSAVDRWAGADGVRRELGIPQDAPLVGAIGNLKPLKGQEHLLRAAALVRRTRPDARFVLVGLGPRESELRREAAGLGLDGSVTFTGFREDAPRIAAALDVYVQPSEAEGLPIALLEAMALRRPVVATSVGGTPEVIRGPEEGVLVPPRDPEALAGSILALLGDPQRRRDMGEAAEHRARGFDIRRAVRRIEEVYEELVA